MLFLITLVSSDVESLICALQYLKRGECKYDSKALKRLHSEPLLNFDCISLWEWKQHRRGEDYARAVLTRVNSVYIQS
ncbi:hypothetical protein KY284_007964 [Solanum tuberosum]|nr:hypothetical protein KY284_007964 [Solanum tuberosum]